MAPSGLDQLVKGAAPPSVTVPSVKSREPSPEEQYGQDIKEGTPGSVSDPNVVPSSPPQIYLNLLILEASLRSQYLTLRARRRQNVSFLILLAGWNAFFFYALFLQPREDGSGIGGSVYWVVEMTEKVALMGGVVTGILVWGTGQWERGVRWPRRFVAVTNRGLRTMNCKIIVLQGPWWKELWHHLLFLFPLSSFYASHGSNYHYMEGPEDKRHPSSKQARADDQESGREEDLAPGGDCVRLMLLPKPFSPDFRENWELYRTEYWEKENERRASLLQRVRRQRRQRARERGGWFWWLKADEPRPSSNHGRETDGEKTGARQVAEREYSKRGSIRRSEHLRAGSRNAMSSSFDGDERPPSRESRGPSGLSEIRRRSRAISGASRHSSLGGNGQPTDRERRGSRSRSPASAAKAGTFPSSEGDHYR